MKSYWIRLLNVFIGKFGMQRTSDVMIHLICGPIGAGKTTLAHSLAKKYNAIRFSEDEWLSRLYVADAPEGLMQQPAEAIAEWASTRYQRCRVQIDLLIRPLLAQGISVVLDGAAANKEQRDLIRQKALNYQVGFQLYYVDANSECRKERVFQRNIDRGETYAIEVNEGMFDLMEVFFQAPIGEELKGIKKYI